MRFLQLALVLLVIAGIPALAFPEDREFSNFRVLLKDGTRIRGSEGRLTSERLEGTARLGKTVSVPRHDIQALDVSQGSQAGKGFAIGATSGLLTGLLAIAQVGLDETQQLNEGAAVGITAGLTVGGGLIGAAVGSRYKRWSSVPLDQSISLQLREFGVTLALVTSF